jgi:hypothetical protein
LTHFENDVSVASAIKVGIKVRLVVLVVAVELPEELFEFGLVLVESMAIRDQVG